MTTPLSPYHRGPDNYNDLSYKGSAPYTESTYRKGPAGESGYKKEKIADISRDLITRRKSIISIGNVIIGALCVSAIGLEADSASHLIKIPFSSSRPLRPNFDYMNIKQSKIELNSAAAVGLLLGLVGLVGEAISPNFLGIKGTLICSSAGTTAMNLVFRTSTDLGSVENVDQNELFRNERKRTLIEFLKDESFEERLTFNSKVPQWKIGTATIYLLVQLLK